MTANPAPADKRRPWADVLADAVGRAPSRLLGAKGSALAKCLADARHSLGRPLLVVAPDPEVAGDIHNDLLYYLGATGAAASPPLLWPAWDILPFETDHPDVEVAADQVAVLRACLGAADARGAPPLWIVAPITALMQPTLSPKIIQAGGLSASAGSETSPERMAAHLVEGGLEPVAMVDAPGQFSRRGGILDVYPLLGDTPYRIEFFGDEIDTVRAFDPATQQSGPPLTGKITLVDVSREAFRHIDGSHYGLLDYLPPGCAAVIRHPERITRVSGLYAGGFGGGPLFSFEDIAARLSAMPLVVAPDLDSDPWPDPPWRQADAVHDAQLGAAGWERLSGGFETAINELTILINKNVDLVIVCTNDGEEARLRKLLEEKRPSLLTKAKLDIGKLTRGFVHETAGGGVGFVSDHELFGRNSPVRVARKRFSGAPIADFAELREGDYVVHVANGIARFEGIRTLEQNGAEQDFLTLRFAEDARIYVPLSHIDLVQRYIGLGEAKPQLSKLGSAAWARRKEAVEKAVRDIAQDLLATQAKRLSSQGIALPPDDTLVAEFDASFPYDETPDQLSAIDDIRRDQQSPAPMERLLCGDVGFGKTEMAVRAAFRAVNAGYQAAVLVPTTILAEQHYRTFSQRTADYPVRVECLSRFRSASEQKEIVRDLGEGKVDVVVGTHRILSGDIFFKNLGLVVIDEEQKFGVESKERLKRFRADVDILTMTATPIPRTLHMSLLGLRDISNLTTAPRERHSVKTMVARWSKEVVRRAILRELARGGQCFFLHNRVHNIDEMAATLQALVPEARFGVGHGQMAEGELLEVMSRFLDGKLDVLVCTTIIESGVDIPSVNTLFVNEADHFGLSELHQLRGRVGRYKHQAYAYFLVPEKRPISPEATKRLQALQEYTELGAGFRIAMRDLEIRGAGNLLGVEQSGHIHMIGFDLYCRLLERAVAAQKGEPPAEESEAEIDLGTRAFIPPEYIPSEQQRIEFYRRLTRIRDRDALDATRRYVRDRYGPTPGPVERCFRDQEIRVRMIALGIETIGRVDGALAVTFHERAVKRGVMAARHGGLRATPLRKNQWRVEVPGVDVGLEPGDYAAGMADKLLAVLEAGLSDRAGRKPFPEERALPEIAGGTEEKPAAGPGADNGPAEAPEPSRPAALAFFSSDMLDRHEDAGALPPAAPPAPATPSPTPPAANAPAAKTRATNMAIRTPAADGDDGAPDGTSAPPASTATDGKKKKGKSGANAPKTLRGVLLAQREETVAGGARKAAKLPGLAEKPGIIAIGPPQKASPEKVKPFKKKKTEAEAEEQEAARGKDGGARVFGIEPYIAISQIGVIVSEAAFCPIRSDTMTLRIMGEPEKRMYLPVVGMAQSGNRRVTLKFQCANPESATKTAEAFLQAGEARLYDALVEG